MMRIDVPEKKLADTVGNALYDGSRASARFCETILDRTATLIFS